jgi:hypothetical protein
MSLSISVDTSGLEKKILEKSIAMKKSMGEALKEEGGLLALSLVKYTQPFGMGQKAKDQGEKAIQGDLTGHRAKGGGVNGDGYGGVFFIIPDQYAASAVYDQKQNVMRLFVKKTGEVYGADMALWKVNASNSELYAHHQSLRKADGSVTQAGYRTRDIGRWKFVDKWVITQSQFQGYLAFIFPRVGFAKAGWATICRKLGRANTDIPAWIKNHNAPGSVIDNTDKPNPSLTIINEVDYTGRVLSESAKREAIKEREVKIGLAIDRAIKYGVKDK